MDVYKYALPPTIKNYVEARAIKKNYIGVVGTT